MLILRKTALKDAAFPRLLASCPVSTRQLEPQQEKDSIVALNLDLLAWISQLGRPKLEDHPFHPLLRLRALHTYVTSYCYYITSAERVTPVGKAHLILPSFASLRLETKFPMSLCADLGCIEEQAQTEPPALRSAAPARTHTK